MLQYAMRGRGLAKAQVFDTHGMYHKEVKRRVAAHFSWRASHDCFGISQADRILRYIDGSERTIRYPAAPGHADSLQPLADDSDIEDEQTGWHICGEHDAGCSMAPSADFDLSLPGAAPTDALWGEQYPAAESVQETRSDHDAMTAPGLAALPLDDTVPASHHSSASAHSSSPLSALPDSPAELLRYLQSSDFKQQQQEQQARVDDSYTVMRTCPWPVPRQLTVLALRRPSQEHPTMYTLPVSQTMDDRHGSMSDIDKVISSAYLAHNISVQVMKNGAVAFESEADARAFRDHLEAEGHLEVLLSELDSHSLFRAMVEARSVVVLMHAGKDMPAPAQLAATLRQKKSIEEL